MSIQAIMTYDDEGLGIVSNNIEFPAPIRLGNYISVEYPLEGVISYKIRAIQFFDETDSGYPFSDQAFNEKWRNPPYFSRGISPSTDFNRY